MITFVYTLYSVRGAIIVTFVSQGREGVSDLLLFWVSVTHESQCEASLCLKLVVPTDMYSRGV